MKEEIKEKLKNWTLIDNGHPKDNESLYEIVMQTMDEKISESEFYSVVKKKPKTSYKRYGDLHCFAKYFAEGKLR